MEDVKTVDITSLITLIGICLTFFMGVINFFQSRKSNYINNITKYRVEWISTLRQYISELKALGNTTVLIKISKPDVNKRKYREEIERVTSLIKMHLNFAGKIDIVILKEMQELKDIINTYILLSHYRNLSQVGDKSFSIKEFLKDINNKKTLSYIYNLANELKLIDTNKLNEFEINEQKRKLLTLLSDDFTKLQNKLSTDIDIILDKVMGEFEIKSNNIDKLFQIYLKAEWTRCKKETNLWPFNKYNEDKLVRKLSGKYDELNKQYY